MIDKVAHKPTRHSEIDAATEAGLRMSQRLHRLRLSRGSEFVRCELDQLAVDLGQLLRALQADQ